MKKSFIHLLLSIASMSLCISLGATEIGSVNMDRVAADYVAYQDALKKVEGAATTAQEEIDAFKAKLGLDSVEDKVQELQQTAQNPATSDIARQAAEDEARKLLSDNQAKIAQLNAFGNQMQEQNQQNRNKILNPFQLKIREAIIEVAKDKDYDLIVPIIPQKISIPLDDGKTEDYSVFTGNTLYASDSIEITDSVIAVLNAE